MTAPDPSGAVQRLAFFTPLREEDLAHVVADIWRLVNENSTTLTNLEAQMADVSGLLNQVADGLRGPLATSIRELIAENARLATDNAALTGEDVAESAAAGGVKTAFDDVAALFTQTPDVPDVEPLPEPEPTPAPEPDVEPEPSPEPVPGDGSTDVVNPTVDSEGNPIV